MNLAWGGYRNGLIPQSVLVFVGNSDADHGGGPQYLEAGAARGYFACNSAFTRQFGKRLVVNAGNRPLPVQKELYAAYKAHPATNPLAAYPGASNHGWARACDFGSNVQYKGTPEALWMRAHAKDYGFHDTGYGFARVEPWHYDWIPGTATASLDITKITEEVDMPIFELVQAGGDPTVWFSVNRIHRYGVPDAATLADYKFFIGQQGQSADVKSPVNLNSFGTPVSVDGAPASNVAAIASAVAAKVPAVSGAADLSPVLAAIAALPRVTKLTGTLS